MIMRLTTLLTIAAGFAGSALLAHAAAKDDLAKAIQQLADAGGYSWKATTESPQFNLGPTLGKIDKNGCALVSRTWGDNTIQSAHMGDKAATETDDGWRSLAELEADQGDNRGRFRARMLSAFEPPAAEAAELLKGSGDVTTKDGAYAASLSEAKVKELMSFRRGAGSGEGPEISGAEGSVKFWIDQGMLKKYQYSVKGTMTWNNQDREIDRTTTVEISDVGNTKVELPEAAKAKL
jgi:hypothetical protein